jgi:hypothetical protein
MNRPRAKSDFGFPANRTPDRPSCWLRQRVVTTLET